MSCIAHYKTEEWVCISAGRLCSGDAVGEPFVRLSLSSFISVNDIVNGERYLRVECCC